MPDPTPEITGELAKLLLASLRALGDAGEPVRANQIAAKAWSTLRHTHPKPAHKINGLMHRLARQEDALMAASGSEAQTRAPSASIRPVISTTHSATAGSGRIASSE